MTPDEHWAKAFEFALRAEQALERTGPPDYEKSRALSALGLLHAALGGRPE